MSTSLILIAAGAALLQPFANDDGALLQVSASGEPAIWYVDQKSVVRSGRVAEARVVVTHMKGLRVRHVQDLEVSVDCRSRKITPLSVSSYAFGGAPAARRLLSGSNVGFVAQPRTYAASAVSYLCGDEGRSGFSVNNKSLLVSD
jgi:hypothetical protein